MESLMTEPTMRVEVGFTDEEYQDLLAWSWEHHSTPAMLIRQLVVEEMHK